jgi:hypothetical protein
MTPKTLAQGPGYTQAEYQATLQAGHETGWWDERGIPAPWPDDFLLPDGTPNPDWQPGTGPTQDLPPGEQPF